MRDHQLPRSSKQDSGNQEIADIKMNWSRIPNPEDQINKKTDDQINK